MKIVTKIKNKVAVIYLQGNIDVNSADFIETVGWIVKNKTKKIVIDFSKVNMVDYIGISVIAIVYKSAANNDGEIKLCNVPEHVRKLFKLVRIDKILTYYESEKEAISIFQSGKRMSKILNKKLRRKFPRIILKNTIEYAPYTEHKVPFFKGKVLNLSGRGVFIIGEKVFNQETLLKTKIYLLPSPGIVEVDAKVIWMSKDNISPLEYPAMGLEFVNISLDIQKKIVDFIDKHFSNEDI